MYDFTKAVGIIGTITDATKRLLNTREEAKINEVAIHLQGIVLDLQSEMMVIQTNYQEILRSREQLEKKLVEYEDWNKERARYHLAESVGSGIFVYALNETGQAGDTKHWLCCNCYDQRQKSILQRFGFSQMICPRCKMAIEPTKSL